MISYHIDTTKYNQHIFAITLTLDACQNQELMLPNWIEGSYKIRDFAKNVISLSADFPIIQLNKNRFRCQNNDGNIQIYYEVYAFEQTVRTAYLDNEVGFFNPSNILLFPLGKDKENIGIYFNTHFAITTNLTTMGNGYSASNYKELIDYPVMLSSTATTLKFQVANIPHAITFNKPPASNTRALTEHLQQICQHHYQFFNAFFPAENYLFLALLTYNNYGGLEHKNSSALICSEKDLANDTLNDNYIKFLSLCSHEYFHTWWVKTLKPKAFHNLDLEVENYTTQLWIFEGVTSYYDDLSLVRCGIISPGEYLQILEKNINHYLQNKGREKQSLENASLTAWTKFYNPNEASVNHNTNYYNQGGLTLFVLDVLLRKKSGNTLNLDGFIAHLFRTFKSCGLKDNDFRTTLNAWSNYNWDEFFVRYISGTTTLPLKECLEYVGVQIQNTSKQAALGATISENKITSIYEGGTLSDVAVFVGDEIIAFNDEAYNKELLKDYNVGETITLSIKRNAMVHTIPIKLKEMPYIEITLTSDDSKNTNLNSWLFL